MSSNYENKLQKANQFFRESNYLEAEKIYYELMDSTKNPSSCLKFNIKLCRNKIERMNNKGVSEKSSKVNKKMISDDSKDELSSVDSTEEVRIILESGLFDKEWFLEKYPDMHGQDMVLHYCIFGYKEGRNPNRYFDTNWYLSNYKEVTGNPLVHYITKGWKKSYNPSFKFDNDKYMESYLGKNKNINPLSHYFLKGKKEGYNAFRVDYGRKDCAIIIDSGLFDFEWFKLKYPDISGHDEILHFCIHGYKEGRLPNPFFDTSWYVNQYSINDKENPLVHYITHGSKQRFNTSPKFDTTLYLKEYPEVERLNVDPLSHYLTTGRNKGYKRFDCTYKSQFPIDKKSSIAETIAGDVKKLFDFKECDLFPTENNFTRKNLKISFVIPDFGVGGGGHMNIFRMIRLLEMLGHTINIWIYNPINHKNSIDAYEDIVKFYYLLAAKVKLIDSDFQDKACGDVIFATSWDTVWPVMSVKFFKRRMYFVQDFEPLFSPKGARSELAQLSYTKDLDCICASSWLDEKMRHEYDRWSRYFNLTADDSVFYPSERNHNAIPKIVLYARYFTERRAVELALIALEMLADEGEVFHVDMYGSSFPVTKTPYSCNIHDKQTPEELAELYREADVGIVFSLTNYSLVPQEMMACGLPVLEFDTESTRAIYPEGSVVYSGPDPRDIKEKLKMLLKDSNQRERQAEVAKNWVRKFTWFGAAKKVESSITERLQELGYNEKETLNNVRVNEDEIKASVIIPTCNGGSIFKRVLEKVLSQNAPWKYEVIILDSESTDDTANYAKMHDNIIFETIKRRDFNHGATRNYGVSIAKGDFVAFLTQDALPTTKHWLYDLVTMLERFPNAAGVFGKHIAHDDASYYTRKELKDHFDRFSTLPLVMSKDLEMPSSVSKEEWKGILHFYSDNNSCLRKSIWEKIPYPAVQYGEDQLWADTIIKAGYSKLYCPTAVVKHSHDYNPEDVYERAKIDGDFFKYHWGYSLVKQEDLNHIIKSFTDSDTLIGLDAGLTKAEIAERIKVIEMKFTGYLHGSQKEISMFAEASEERSKF